MRGPFPVRQLWRAGPGRSVSCFGKEAYGVRRLSSGRKPCDGAQDLLFCQCLKLVDFSLPRNDRTGMFAAFRCFRILSGQVFMVWSFFLRSPAGLRGLYSHALKSGRNGVNSGTYGKKQRPVSLSFPTWRRSCGSAALNHDLRSLRQGGNLSDHLEDGGCSGTGLELSFRSFRPETEFWSGRRPRVALSAVGDSGVVTSVGRADC